MEKRLWEVQKKWESDCQRCVNRLELVPKICRMKTVKRVAEVEAKAIRWYSYYLEKARGQKPSNPSGDVCLTSVAPPANDPALRLQNECDISSYVRFEGGDQKDVAIKSIERQLNENRTETGEMRLRLNQASFCKDSYIDYKNQFPMKLAVDSSSCCRKQVR